MLVCQLPTLQSGREPGEERGVPPSALRAAAAAPPQARRPRPRPGQREDTVVSALGSLSQ